MIALSYSQLNKNLFQESVQKLARCQLKTPDAVFRIKKVIKALQENLDKMGDAYKQDILVVYAKGGQKPEMAIGKSAELNLPFDCVEGKEEEAKKALDAFGAREFTIDAKKISAEVLFSAGPFSASELIALEPIVAELALVD